MYIHTKEGMDLACPNTNSAVSTPLGQVTISYSYTLDNSGRFPLFRRNASTTVPLPALYLIIHLDHVLSGGADDPPGVKHHARDWIVVGISIINRASAEIPNLPRLLVSYRATFGSFFFF